APDLEETWSILAQALHQALDALEEIRASFRRSGITKEELLKAGRALRRRLSKEIRDAGR
ncbi:MAG: hypothetical protein QME89_12695, partial [Actinomycetota bacterium]|nr:hypothetical protein [Actinomycetota bacterium]